MAYKVETIQLHGVKARMDFSELALDASEDRNHPNRMPFKGVLLVTDKPSDQPPHGAEGHLIEVPSEVAKRRLRSLIGMGVNYADDLEGHEPRKKVGVITSARIDGNKVRVNGFIWKKDFPESERDIKDNRTLGMSMELGDVYVRDRDEDVWHLEDLQFTGATILKRESAAYWNTQLAASAERIKTVLNSQGGTVMDNDKDKDKKAEEKAQIQTQILAAAIKASLADGIAPLVEGLKASQEAASKEMKAAIEKLGESMADSQVSIMAALEALAGVEAESDVDAAGRGDDATSDATGDSTNDATRDDATADATYDAAADPKIDAKPGEPGDLNPDATSNAKKQARSGASGQLKAERDKRSGVRVESVSAAAIVISRLQARAEKAERGLVKAERRVNDLEAQVDKFGKRVERKSISSELSNLLAKGGYNISEVLASASGSRKPMSVPDFDTLLERSNLNLSPTDRVHLKNQATQLGFLEDGVVSRPWQTQ